MVDITKSRDAVSAGGWGLPDGMLERVPQATKLYNEEKPDFRTQSQKTSDAILYAIPNALIGGMSEVAESMPGIDEADAAALVKGLTTEGMYQNFKEHEDAYKLTGSLALSSIPIFGVQKLMRAKSLYTKAEKILGQRVTKAILPSKVSSAERIEEARNKATILAKSQVNTINREVSKDVAASMRKAGWTEALDMFKIGVATDLGMYGMLNESDFLFPEDMSAIETAAMYGLPNAIFSGVAGAMMRYKMKNVIRDVGEIGAEARNAAGLPVDEVFARPGQRDNIITTYAEQRAIKAGEKVAAGGDSTLLANINSQEQALKVKIMDQVGKIAEDSMYPGITSKYSLTTPEQITLDEALKFDPTVAFGAFSFEKFSALNVEYIPAALKKKTQDVGDELVVKMAQYNAMDLKDPARAKLAGELASLHKLHKDLSASSVIKVDVDGTMSLAHTLKPGFKDYQTGVIKESGEGNIVPNLKKTNFGDIVKIKNGLTKEISYGARFSKDDNSLYGMVTPDFKILVPPKGLRPAEYDTKKIISLLEANTSENYRASLNIIGEVYHYNSGQKGQQMFSRLSAPAQKALQDWTIDSNRGVLRQGTEESQRILDEIYNANEEVRQALREVADADGTIPLLRGENVSMIGKPIFDLVSTTANPQVAAKFGVKEGHAITVVRVNPDDIVAVVGGIKGINEYEYIIRGNLRRAVGDEITSKSYNELTMQGKSTIQALMREQIKSWNPATSPVMHISESSHHTQIDGALELINKFGANHPGIREKIQLLSKNIQNVDDLTFTSLAKKFGEYKNGVDEIGGQVENILKLGKGHQKTLEDLIIELNLPNNGITGLHPVVQMFNDLHLTGVRDLREVYSNLDEVKAGLQKLVSPRGDLEGRFIPHPQMSFVGNQLKVYAEERKPVLMLVKDHGINPLNKEEIIAHVAQQRAALIEGLINSQQAGAPLITEMVTEMLRDAERLKQAKNVAPLMEGSQRGSDRFVQTMHSVENIPTIKAQDSITAATDNAVKSYTAKQFAPHEKTFNKLLSSNNKGDLNFFNIAVHQQGRGWRGTPELIPVEEGGKVVGYKIPLEDHPKNKQMLNDVYGVSGEEAVGMDFIPAPAFKKGAGYEPLVISPLAAESMLAINKISQDVLSHINQLRKLSGLKEITRKALHMLPKNLADKEKVYLIDSHTGELHSVASGNTATQARTFAEEEIINAEAQDIKLFIATDKDLENFNMLKLDDFTRMVDFSTSFKQTGAARGASYGQVIETGPEVLKRMQEILIKQYATVGKVTSAMFFEPELRHLELSAITSGLSGSTLKNGRTIWDTSMRRILGKKSGNKQQTIGNLYGAAEDVYDKILQKVWDEKVSLLKGGQTGGQAEREWEGLNKIGADYNPFKDSVEYIQNTMRIKPPHNMIKHMAKMNALVGATMLRMGELGLAAVNIMTLPTLIPVVAGSLKRGSGETLEAWKGRIGAWSSVIDEEASLALFNPYKATVTGTHFFFTEEGRAVIKEAGEKGHLWQKTVEQMQLFTSPSKGYHERMITKAVDFTSIAVDKTEEWSRGLSYSTFYKMGKDNLQLNHSASMEFAHQMANKVIGDFRPNNRPQIFQGAAGMPFGLFTTFAWNYMQRVFGYMEKGDFQSFFRQMGLQAGFFGSKSLPGFNQYVDCCTSNYDGTENMVDRLQRSYGTETTDALLFGSVGSLTGIAAWTRTDIRLPGSNFLQNYNIADMAPAAGAIKTAYKGISEFARSLSANQGLNSQQISEIAARTFPVKSVRGWIELGNGQSVDSRGQIVNEKLNTTSAIAAKMMSMKPIREQLLIEEAARIRSTSLKQKDARDDFKMALRASFRSGSLDKDRLDALIMQYGKSTGGDFSNLKSTLRNEMEAALINKGYLQVLHDAGKESSKDSMLRMINILTNENYE